MIKGLIKAAADLDSAGFHVEADVMDRIMQKVAESTDFGFLPSGGMSSAKSSDSAEDSEDDYEDESEEDESDEDESDEDESEEESDDDGEEEHSVEECMTYCSSFSHEDKVELIKAILDSMME